MRIPKNAEADTLLHELHALAASSPGDQPDVLEKVRTIITRWQSHSDDIVRIRAGDALHAFEVWLSLGDQWNRSGDGGTHSHDVLVSAITRLGEAITSDAWKSDPQL
jgi:hypothetical protein